MRGPPWPGSLGDPGQLLRWKSFTESVTCCEAALGVQEKLIARKPKFYVKVLEPRKWTVCQVMHLRESITPELCDNVLEAIEEEQLWPENMRWGWQADRLHGPRDQVGSFHKAGHPEHNTEAVSAT